MELLNFLNNNLYNWEEILSRAPYFLKISYDGPYVMLKYQQFASDMSLSICQQARGAIFRLNKNKTAYIPVSIAMYKFFNSEEPYAAPIDWNTAIVTEKVDGSLMKLGYDKIDKHWLLSTNGTIFAANADINGETNFGSQFMKIIGGYRDFNFCAKKTEDFINSLDKNYCYYFELVSPETRIVCRYDSALYYLGRRNMETMEEDFSPQEFDPTYKIKVPRHYALDSKEACIAAAQNLGENNEGFVVRDGFGRRVKIKSPWYLAMHHLRGNGRLTTKNILEYWQAGILDDYLGQYPEYSEQIFKVLHCLEDTAVAMDTAWGQTNMINDRKDFAHMAFLQPSLIRTYLFARKDNRYRNAFEYLKDLHLKVLSGYIQEKIGNLDIGVEEDV